ncbi:DUF6880 family protein [Novosphingobium sp.]|uniref:DUF6880 family protein n=1 Tax=Novosphingobium sp. TaxID=1874826 RepID=UPI003B51ECA6
MASEKTLNAKNLTALGAERLAELVLELATGNAAAKRRLRLELASRTGGSDAALEIRKRLIAIAKAKTFLDWRKIKPFARDLEVQRAAIMAHVAPSAPGEAFELLWRMLAMVPGIFDRCDDSSGLIGAVMRQALADLGTLAGPAAWSPAMLADRVYGGVIDNKYGQFNGLIELMAKPLGGEGLASLKSQLENLATTLPSPSNTKGANEYGLRLDELSARGRAREIRRALTDIADVQGDVDGYIAHFSAAERAVPAVAADIAERLLKAGRAAEAMAALTVAEPAIRPGSPLDDWQRVRIDTLDALGRPDDAQAERWALFARDLDATYLRAHIKRLPDFDDEEAEIRALDYVARHPDFNRALAFLVDWPAPDLAAKLIMTRQGELDGNQYDILNRAAEVLENRHPLAATLALRAMIDFTLIKARHTRYAHAARHLQTCADLGRHIADFGDRRDHAAYVAHLRLAHGRKAAFWDA